MARQPELVVSVEEVAGYFAELEDPRSEVNLKHPLVSVVTIAVMAVMAGADGPTAIARWAALKAEFLQRVLPLPHGVPKKDVFGRVLAALQPGAFQAGFERWAHLTTIGIAVLICLRDGKETTQMRYYISSLELGVRQFARAVRGHWGIENSLHWSLDMTYREDQLRHRHEHLRQNFAWLSRFTLSLLKQHPAKMSLAMKRRSCGWDENFLLQVVIGQGS